MWIVTGYFTLYCYIYPYALLIWLYTVHFPVISLLPCRYHSHLSTSYYNRCNTSSCYASLVVHILRFLSLLYYSQVNQTTQSSYQFSFSHVMDTLNVMHLLSLVLVHIKSYPTSSTIPSVKFSQLPNLAL